MKKLILIFFIVSAGFPFGGKSQQSISELEQVQAIGASEFLNSIGVCSSITGRGETLQGTIEALEYTGIRFIRCGLEDDISTADMIELHRKTGAKIVYGLLSGGTDIERLIQESRVLAEAGALLAIEGNNEPNNWGVNRGEKGGENHSWLPVAKLQRDLYKAVKSDPVLKNIPVWNISESGAQTDNVGLQFLKIPEGAEALMPAGTQYADFANCHNYITHPSWPGLHDNQTWLSADPGPECPVDGLYGNYGKTWGKGFEGYSEEELKSLPRVTTETGIAAKDEITEEIQAKLFLNLYLSQFKRGWSYTSVYLLRTRSNEPAHEPYAFYKMDYSPKQAAHYLHNLTIILEDNGTNSIPGKLSYFIENRSETVHDLLLQKSNGKFFLVLWGERFTGGTDKITVQLDHIYSSVKIYDPTHGKSPVKHLSEDREITFFLSNHPLIIELQ
ncbi:MAG: glycosyl hydrolase [Bacteroidota bacterium]